MLARLELFCKKNVKHVSKKNEKEKEPCFATHEAARLLEFFKLPQRLGPSELCLRDWISLAKKNEKYVSKKKRKRKRTLLRYTRGSEALGFFQTAMHAPGDEGHLKFPEVREDPEGRVDLIFLSVIHSNCHRASAPASYACAIGNVLQNKVKNMFQQKLKKKKIHASLHTRHSGFLIFSSCHRASAPASCDWAIGKVVQKKMKNMFRKRIEKEKEPCFATHEAARIFSNCHRASTAASYACGIGKVLQKK
jgi:hypothetical protein